MNNPYLDPTGVASLYSGGRQPFVHHKITAGVAMKFGGKTVGRPHSLRNAIGRAAAAAGQRPVAVVSALGGVTDQLEELCSAVRHKRLDTGRAVLGSLARRHEAMAEETLSAGGARAYKTAFNRALESLTAEAAQSAARGDGSPAARDRLAAFGEYASALLFARLLEERGAPAQFVDARSFLLTDARFGEARPLPHRAKTAARLALAPVIAAGAIPVTQGFVGVTPTGETTTMGRNGGDLTAAFLGEALTAPKVQIFTDVRGLYTDDPNRNPKARLLPRLSYRHALALAENGARAIYPPALHTLAGKAVTVQVLCADAPDCPGTSIDCANLDRGEAYDA